MEEVKHLDFQVKEKRVREEGNMLIAVVVGILLFMISLIIVFGLSLSTTQIIVFVLIILAFYVIVISFLFEPRLMREIINTITNTVEKPVYKEIRVPVNQGRRIPVIYEVPKPIIREVIKTVDRPVLIKEERKKLNIPKYEYVGSSETRKFHKRSCRLSKLIKRKYKLSSNESQFFIKKRFTPCKVCIKRLSRKNYSK